MLCLYWCSPKLLIVFNALCRPGRSHTGGMFSIFNAFLSVRSVKLRRDWRVMLASTFDVLSCSTNYHEWSAHKPLICVRSDHLMHCVCVVRMLALVLFWRKCATETRFVIQTSEMFSEDRWWNLYNVWSNFDAVFCATRAMASHQSKSTHECWFFCASPLKKVTLSQASWLPKTQYLQGGTLNRVTKNHEDIRSLFPCLVNSKRSALVVSKLGLCGT